MKHFYSLVFVAASAALFGQDSLNVLWERTYDTTFQYSATAIVPWKNGNYLIAHDELRIFEYSQTGDFKREFFKRNTSAGHSHNSLDVQGDTLIAHGGLQGYQIFVEYIDSSGTSLAFHNVSSGQSGTGDLVKIGNDHALLYMTNCCGTGQTWDTEIKRLNGLTSSAIWNTDLCFSCNSSLGSCSAGGDIARDLQWTGSSLIAVGHIVPSPCLHNGRVISIDPNNGSVNWTYIENGFYSEYNAVSNFGADIIVAGSKYQSPNRTMFAQKFDAAGNQLWNIDITSNVEVVFSDMLGITDSTFILYGTTSNGLYVAVLDISGNIQFEKEIVTSFPPESSINGIATSKQLIKNDDGDIYAVYRYGTWFSDVNFGVVKFQLEQSSPKDPYNPESAYVNNRGCVVCDQYAAGDTFSLDSGATWYTAVDRPLLETMRDNGDDLSKVCVSLVSDMNQLFISKALFNQDISSWDVSNVTDMSVMFFSASSFNTDISNWDVGNVTDMSLMFYGASAFNQNLSSWCVPNIPSYPNNFATLSGLSSSNYPVWGSCPCLITLDFGTDTLAVCGSSHTLDAGAGFSSYLWSTGDSTQTATISSSGMYSCTVGDNGCFSTDSLYVSLLDASITASDSVVCAGDSVTLTAGGGMGSASASSLPAYLPSSDILAHFDFENGSLTDISGNSSSFQNYGGHYTLDEKGNSNSALEYNGSNTYSQVTLNQQISGNFSIFLRLFNPVNNDGTADKIISFPADQFDFMKSSDELRVYPVPSFQLLTTPLQENKWTDIFITRINGVLIVYLDGVLSDSLVFNSTPNLGSVFNVASRYHYAPSECGQFTLSELVVGSTGQRINQTMETYNWSTGDTTQSITANPLQTTTYYCTVSDGISTCTDSVTVYVNSLPLLDLGTDTLAVCGSSHTLDAGAGFSSYLWSTGDSTQTITVSNTGLYSCTVGDNGCFSTDSIYISLLDASITASDSVVCAGDSVNLINEIRLQQNAWSSLPRYLPSHTPVAYFDFTNGSTNDVSGNGSSLQNFGGQFISDENGIANNAIRFDGVSEYAQITLSENLENDFTIFLRIHNPPNSDATYDRIIGFENYNLDLAKGGSNLNLHTPNCGWNPLTGTLSHTNWHDFVLTKKGSVLYVFVDEVLTDSLICSSSYFGDELFLGKPSHNGEYSHYTVSELVFYNQGIRTLNYSNASNLSYNWSTGDTTASITANPTQTTTYFCTVSDGISTCTDSVTVYVNSLPLLDLGTDTLAVCGSSHTLDAGAGFSSYLWSTGDSTQTATISSSGMYSCTVGDNGCFSTDSLYVSLLDASITASDSVVCAGDSVLLSVGALNVPSSVNSGSDMILTDLTWKGSSSNQQGWRDAGFDDSSWNFCVPSGTTPIISPSMGIWVGGFTNSAGIVYMRKDFSISDSLSIDSAVLQITADNYFTVYINDSLVGSGNDWGIVYSFDVSSYLRTGDNVIAVEGGNSGGPAMLTSRLDYFWSVNEFDYTWSTGDSTQSITLSPTQATTYYCTVSDGISTCTDSVTVYVNSPLVDLGADTLSVCGQDSVLLDAGAGHSSYLWNTGETTQTIYADSSGTYSVEVSDGTPSSNSNSLSFDGVDDYVNLGPSNILDAHSDFSISFSIKNPSANGTNGQIFWHANDGFFMIDYKSASDMIKFSMKDANLNDYTISVPHNSADWEHYSATYDFSQKEMKLFKSSLLIDSLTLTTNNLISDPAHPNIMLGAVIRPHQGDIIEVYGGLLDDLSIWNTALTKSEIQQYMSCPPTGNEAGLVGYWNFDEGSGSVANDLSGNGNHGTINGATWSSDVPSQSCGLGCTATDSVYVNLLDASITADLCSSTNSITLTAGEIDSSLVNSGRSLPAYLPTNGLVAWYPFNGNANDESGNGNNGSAGSGVALTTDRFFTTNAAYDFNGSGNITLTSIPTSGSQDFTISGWVKTNNTTVRKGIACWGQDNPWNSTYFYITNNGYLKFDFAYNGGPQSPTFIADNNWHSVSITCTNGLVQLFLDGVTTGTSISMSPNISGSNKALGANITNSGSNNFVGNLDDFGIWNRALSPSEIQALYTAQAPSNISYNWSTGATTQSITVSPSQATTYYCTVSDGISSCTDSITIDAPITVDSVVAVNANKGVYKAHFSGLSPSGSYSVEFKSKSDTVWRSKSIRSVASGQQRFNLTPLFNDSVDVRVSEDGGGNTSCELTIGVPCKIMTIQTAEQESAFCQGDSALVRVIYAGGRGAKSILWSNGATTKRTHAQQGETLSVTVTDSRGCSVTDSITATTLSTSTAPSNLVINRFGAIITADWNAAQLSSSQTLLGYKLNYRLKNTQTWTKSALITDTSTVLNWTGSGIPAGNYEFVVFARYIENGVATNSNFSCITLKGYNGVGGKSEGADSAEPADVPNISVYPNPTDNILYVQAPENSSLTLVDMNGKTLTQLSTEAVETSIDMSSYAQGIYVLQILIGEAVETRMIVRK